MRELVGHKVNGVNGVNDAITITVMDDPGYGGACHHYRLSWPINNGILTDRQALNIHFQLDIHFQDGPIAEVGTNGATHENLIAILIDRLEGFQSGQYACEDNRIALEALEVAQKALLARTRARLARTRARLARGVEGTHTV